MKAYLYKLKEGWVLCSDEEIKSGDTILHKSHDVISIHKAREIVGMSIVVGENKESSCWIDYSKKVLTQSPDLSSLSPDKQKEIGWFDYSAFSDSFTNQVEDSLTKTLLATAMRAAYLKALELTADRRFTEDDMQGFVIWLNDNWRRGKSGWRHVGDFYKQQKPIKTESLMQKYLESISQPKSWEVEYQEENGVYEILKLIK